MLTLQLQKVLYKKINSFFEIKENMQLKVQNQSSLGVNYSDDNKTCFATLTNKTFAPDQPDIFNIEIELVGIFSCEGIKIDEDKKKAHVRAYELLFPYIQLMVADLSRKAGLSPLMIEMAQIDSDAVNDN